MSSKYSFISFLAALLLIFGSLSVPGVLKPYYIIFCVLLGVISTVMTIRQSVTTRQKWMSIFMSVVYIFTGALVYTALTQ